MPKWKKIVLPIIILALLAGYVAGVSFAVNQIFTPDSVEPLEFGDYNVENANNEIDAEDEKDNTLYNNINARLLYSEQDDLNELKLITLYKLTIKEEATPINESQTIMLEISEKLANDISLRIIKIESDKSLRFIEASIEKRTEENNESYVLIFDVEEEGYYGLVSKRGEAALDWVIVLASIIAIILLFVILFIILKPKRLSERKAI